MLNHPHATVYAFTDALQPLTLPCSAICCAEPQGPPEAGVFRILYQTATMGRPAWALIDRDQLLLAQGLHRMLPRNSAMALAAGPLPTWPHTPASPPQLAPRRRMVAVPSAAPSGTTAERKPDLRSAHLAALLHVLEHLAEAKAKTARQKPATASPKATTGTPKRKPGRPRRERDPAAILERQRNANAESARRYRARQAAAKAA